MVKNKTFGYKTPRRRNTKNITGNKVGGDYTGGECRIIGTNRFDSDDFSVLKKYHIDPVDYKVFEKFYIFGIGGYFLFDYETEVTFSIKQGSYITKKSYKLDSNKRYSLGADLILNEDQVVFEENVECVFSLTSKHKPGFNYVNFNYGQLLTHYYNDEFLFDHFNNSKKDICIPEQFYFNDEVLIDKKDSIDNKIKIIKKSCNRCQRLLPINPLNQREQLAFSNHCSSKAPCTHKNFANYTILNLNDVDVSNLGFNSSQYKLENGTIIAYFGHQLECKACKKFFVNAALNHLRSSTQHREDSLRRRAIELLIGHLLKKEWIYHLFRLENGIEFDKYIREKFDKKCFKCGCDIASEKVMHLDHTMPLAYLYPLDDSATCLCAICNNAKSDIFPIDFYKKDELNLLSDKTGLHIDVLSSRKANDIVSEGLRKELKRFIEDFLNHPEYIKVRDGKKACDSIFHSVQKAVKNSNNPYDMREEYEKGI